jgi:broad specificity phosphatase PhoE
MTKFILLRHGQSEGNLKGLYLGHTDLDITELGRKQAEITAEYLKNEKIDAIYSSDLKRAHNTALPHAKLRGIPVIDKRELREIYLGEWEGELVEVLRREHYDEFEIEWKRKFGTFIFPSGESVMSCAERMYNALIDIAETSEDKCVLVAAHAAIIRAFWCKISGFEPERWGEMCPFPTNASLTFVDYENGKFYPQKFSFDEHFDKEFITKIKQ